MLSKIPDSGELLSLMGKDRYAVWEGLCAAIEEKYDTDILWDKGGKAWTYERKYRRGGKTLCALYARENVVGLMMIFGKDERAKIDRNRAAFSENVMRAYDEATTYHDGKWVMFTPEDLTDLPGYLALLSVKRKPNRK